MKKESENMEFTGERYIPTEQGRIRLEHYHRYAMVLDVVKEKDVLDVACGEGYGSSCMADVARSVVGVDISDEAVQHASSSYKKPNLAFRQGSATALDFAEASFDVVVSFETIEHLAEQAQMLAEIRRVLRPNGVLVISSPNRPIYSEEIGEPNEFHVKELDFNEFDALLRTQFPNIQYFGQRMLMGSVIQPLEGGQSSFRAWHDDGNDLKPNAGHLAEPVYFVAVCGIHRVDLPSIDTSVLYPDKLDLVKHYVGFAKWAQTLDRIVAERDGQIANLNQVIITERDAQLDAYRLQAEQYDLQVRAAKEQIANLNQAMAERDGSIISLTDEIVRRGEWALRLDAELKEERVRLHEITHSNSWRLTLPIREAFDSAPGKQAKRYAREALRLAKSIYQSLHFSYQTKAARRNALAIIRGVAVKFKNAVLILNKIFYYIQKYGVKESFLTIRYKAKQRRPTIKLDSSTRISLQNILSHLSISLESEQLLTALINMLGQERTSRIMANIVEVEKFIFTKNNGEVYPIIHASQLPIPLPQTRKRNILFITSEFPNPHHGGGNRVLNFIKTLSAGNNIYLCTAFFTNEHEHILPSLASYCREILKIPFGRFGGNQDEIRNWLGATTIDIVHYEWQRSLENYAADFGRTQIFTFMEAVSLRLLMDMERLPPLSAIWLEKLEELAYALWLEFVQASKVDARIAVTKKDAKYFSNLYPFQEYAVLNHGLDFDEFTLPDIEAEPYTLIFVGNYLHYPNADALEFFFNEIWENIRMEIPDIRIYVVGANPPDNLLRRSDGKQIIITGTVADVRPYIQKASVCIAPLISGAGLRGKVIEYAALHRPFVATSIASTDLVFKDGIDYFCADTPLEFSDKIITLLKDPQLARRMAEAAYVTARQNYDNQLLTRYLLSLYEHWENCPDV